jgi:hypothetical protein
LQQIEYSDLLTLVEPHVVRNIGNAREEINELFTSCLSFVLGGHTLDGRFDLLSRLVSSIESRSEDSRRAESSNGSDDDVDTSDSEGDEVVTCQAIRLRAMASVMEELENLAKQLGPERSNLLEKIKRTTRSNVMERFNFFAPVPSGSFEPWDTEEEDIDSLLAIFKMFKSSLRILYGTIGQDEEVEKGGEKEEKLNAHLAMLHASSILYSRMHESLYDTELVYLETMKSFVQALDAKVDVKYLCENVKSNGGKVNHGIDNEEKAVPGALFELTTDQGDGIFCPIEAPKRLYHSWLSVAALTHITMRLNEGYFGESKLPGCGAE